MQAAVLSFVNRFILDVAHGDRGSYPGCDDGRVTWSQRGRLKTGTLKLWVVVAVNVSLHTVNSTVCMAVFLCLLPRLLKLQLHTYSEEEILS